MSEKTEIKCDACEADLTWTGNSIAYRLALVNQQIPSRGGAVTDMMVYPPIKATAHFCGTKCLRDWVGGLTHG